MPDVGRLVMMIGAILALVFPILKSGDVRPPLRRTWTELSDDETEILDIKHETLLYRSNNRVRLLDLKDGKPKWTYAAHLGDRLATAAANTRTIYVDVSRKKANTIVGIDRSTGKVSELGLAVSNEHVRKLACDEKRLFVLSDSGSVRAINPVTKSTLWRRDLTKGKPFPSYSMSIQAGEGHLFVGIDSVGAHCLDASNGKVLWKETPKYRADESPTFLPKGVITYYDGAKLKNYQTGRVIWDSKLSSFEPTALHGPLLLGDSGGRSTLLNVNSGAIVWRESKEEEGRYRRNRQSDQIVDAVPGFFLSDGDGNHIRIDEQGKVQWRLDRNMDGVPIYLDSKRLITADRERICCYEPGSLAPVPADEASQKTLANRLVDQYELLDSAEREQLVQVGKFASKRLIERYTQWVLDSHDGTASKRGQDMRYYTLATDTPDILDRICGPADTDALLTSLSKIGGERDFRGAFTYVVGRKADQARVIPLFLAKIKADPDGQNESSSTMLKCVAESHFPAAVDFMIDALDNPRSPLAWRAEAYTHLAETGGERGIQAILAMRGVRGPRPTWQERFSKPISIQKVLSTKKDAKGQTWRLVQSSVLGNSGDLFIQRQTATGWDLPYFCGFSTAETFRNEAPKTYKGIAVDLLTSSTWIKTFVEDPAIRKDSDSDGLSDLVEARLGTDPKKADTDDDGLNDAVDPCPNAAPRPMGDKEKIIATCLETHFIQWGPEAPPALISVDGMKPFEMYGYGGPLIWSESSTKSGLKASYGAGMNAIGFSPFITDFRKELVNDEVIKFSDDGKSAATLIQRYSGGLNGEGMNVKLKKIGDDWFVVEMTMAYIS